MTLEILYALSTGILGIFLGAQICEGALFVPYWKSLSPSDFYKLHQTYGKKIYQFFAPLTIAATVIPVSTAIYSISVTPSIFSLLMGGFTILFFSTFYLYFKKANQQFAEASIPYNELPKAINRWGRWHWGRVGLELMAFICSLIALVQV